MHKLAHLYHLIVWYKCNICGLLHKCSQWQYCYSMFTLLSTCASELHIPTKFHPNQSSNHIPPRCSNGAVSISQYGDCGVANLIPVAWLVTALVWYITIHGWVITTSGFRRQTTTILDRFIIWPHSSLWHAVVFNTTKFRRNVTPGGQFKLRAKFGPCSIGILNLKFLALTVSELWRGPRIIKAVSYTHLTLPTNREV